MIRLKRAYEDPSPQDGARWLVDRLWPRGRAKEALELSGWRREVAPSDELRAWFDHDPDRWEEFRRRYREELSRLDEELAPLVEAARDGDLTLVYAARDEERNNAAVLAEVLRERLG